MIIAIDGPAASGKGTIAKKIAAHFGLPHMDTGLIYRSLAAKVLSLSIEQDNQSAIIACSENLNMNAFDVEELKHPQVAQMASIVSAIPQVRANLLSIQQTFANRAGGAVLDGRDVGTVIAPHADVKIFITARNDIRAQRRYLELRRTNEDLSFQSVLDDIERRDERDKNRATAPLVMAQDAHLLDTSELGIEATFQKALEIILSHTRG